MMRLNPIVILCTSMYMIIAAQSYAQDNIDLSSKINSISNQLVSDINKKTSLIENHIISTSERALNHLSKQERRLQKKLHKKDALLTKQLFHNTYTKYQILQSDLTNKASRITGRADYIPFLDTITTSIHFLQKNALANNSSIQQVQQQVSRMQQRFQQSKTIQQYLYRRQQYLKDKLSKLGMAKELQQYNKTLYYYQVQIAAYKDLLNQPDKITRKAIDLLNKTKPFQEFLARNSLLASIFPVSNNGNAAISQAGLTGLQTSAQVNSLIQQTAGRPNNLQALQSNMQQVQSQIQQLKNKINEKGGSSDKALPDFRPNQQRVKTFWDRLEFGTNLQSTRSNAWLPSATQVGLSVGYKLNDQSVVGLGMAGSIGWGKSINHIIVSYEGVGARSYLDWKIKGSFWLSAGYEMNYSSSFAHIEQLKTLEAWQQSGLIGIRKKYKVSKKLKGSLSLLWDMLSYSQIPRTQPIVFRFGYSFK